MDDLNNSLEESKNICPDCGSENIETAKFCVDCGQNILNNKETENICYSCGTINPQGIKFCPECGQNLLDQSTLNKSNNSSGNLSDLISSKRSVTQRKGLLHKLHEDVGKAAIKAKSDIVKSVEDYTLGIEFEVNESQDSYIVTIQLPNIKKEDLDINITPRKINLKAEFDQEVEIEQGTQIVRRELHRGTFAKDIILRTPIVPENAEAEFTNDLLIIKLPKADSINGHKLKF
jgi:HSP20 family molecular chaperone IbpA/ribosomal protein L40E